MITLRTILCPVDFSPPSQHAFQYAMSLARQYDASLHLLHAVPPVTHEAVDPGSLTRNGILTHEEEMERQLQIRLAVLRHEGLRATGAVLKGKVEDVLKREAQRPRIDLVVMGTHGYRGIKRWMLGSVTEQLLRHLDKPLLIITSKSNARMTLPNLKRVLITTDFSEGTQDAIRYGFSLAEEYQAEVALLHVVPQLPDSWQRLNYQLASKDIAKMTAQAKRALEELVPEEARLWCTVAAEVRHGAPHQEIIHFIQSWAPDLLVMNIHGASFMDRAILGTTAERVIRPAACPVLAVPPLSQRSPTRSQEKKQLAGNSK